MFTWADIILLILKIVNAITTQVGQDKWTQAGKDAEIAAEAQAILRKTQTGKAIMEKVDAMDAQTVDAELHKLEPQ